MNDSPKQHGKCSFCDTEVYVKVKQYLMPALPPLTHEQALRDELVNMQPDMPKIRSSAPIFLKIN